MNKKEKEQSYEEILEESMNDVRYMIDEISSMNEEELNLVNRYNMSLEDGLLKLAETISDKKDKDEILELSDKEEKEYE